MREKGIVDRSHGAIRERNDDSVSEVVESLDARDGSPMLGRRQRVSDNSQNQSGGQASADSSDETSNPSDQSLERDNGEGPNQVGE